MSRSRGGPSRSVRPSLWRGHGAAWLSAGALLAGVVGVLIQAVESRLGVFGRLLGFLGGLAWAVATFLVIPVLAFEDVGPIEALKKSSHLIKTTFGTIARGALRFGVLLLGWILPALAVIIAVVVVEWPVCQCRCTHCRARGDPVFIVSMYLAAAGMTSNDPVPLRHEEAIAQLRLGPFPYVPALTSNQAVC